MVLKTCESIVKQSYFLENDINRMKLDGIISEMIYIFFRGVE